jgi:hypothetical protein
VFDGTFKDRKLVPAGWTVQGAPSFMMGAKLGSLMHTKSRIFRWLDTSGTARRVLLTGSLNPGEESMFNDESLLTISDPYLMDRYELFFETLVSAQEKKWVNEFNPVNAINVMFSPNSNGYDVGSQVLKWIDEEQEVNV